MESSLGCGVEFDGDSCARGNEKGSWEEFDGHDREDSGGFGVWNG